MATVEVEFFKYPKVKYSTKQPPLDKGTKTQCFLKEETSVLNPVLQIRGASTTFGGSEFPDFNLAYIADFHRYYFVRNITSVSALIWEVALEVDPLASYKNEILNASAFIQYAESGYNISIPDTRLPQTIDAEFSYYGNLEWTENVFSNTGVYMLTAMNQSSDGVSGLATTYACTNAKLQAVSNSLNADSWSELARYFSRPMDAFISCIWLPIKPMIAGSDFAASEIKFGEYGTGVTAPQARETITRSTVALFQLPYSEGDYRNVEPYTEMRITLPGVGLIQIPLTTVAGKKKNFGIKISYTIDVVTGNVVYRLANTDDATFMVCDGKIGVPLPISSSTFNVGGLMSSAASAIGGAVTVAAASALPAAGAALITGGGIVTATSGAIGAATNMIQNVSSVSGSLGSTAGIEINNGSLFYSIITHKVSSEPSSVSKVIGRPVFKTGKISSCGSFVQCTGAQVESSASAEEADAINSYLKGGILIE